MNLSLKAHAAIVSLVIIGFSACNVRRMPGLKQIGKREEERITRETEEAIKQSAELQELDRLCTQVVPRPDGFVPVNKFQILNGRVLLGYGYLSSDDYQLVKRFYLDYFAQHGWQVSHQKDGGWGPSTIEFRNNTNKVTISESGSGGEGINYFVECEKL